MTRRCSVAGCTWPARVWAARIVPPVGDHRAKFVVRGIDDPEHVGAPICLDHAHGALDVMVAGTLPPAEVKPEATP